MENTSGVYPVGDRILVKPDQVKKQSDGGIVYANETIEQQANSQVAGVLVANGPDAWTDYQGPFAKPGHRVMFAKYHGNRVIGTDGKEYRILNDIDVTAVIEEGVEFNDLQTRKPLE